MDEGKEMWRVEVRRREERGDGKRRGEKWEHGKWKKKG